MTLEEFLAVKAPSNYVEAPVSPEEFKKPTPKPEVTGVQTAPVSPKAEQIKKMFSLAPTPEAPVAPEQQPVEQAQPQQPTEKFQPSPISFPTLESADYAMTPTSDLVDMEKIRSQAEKMVKEPTWGEFLTALSPLAIEAIAGGGTTNVAPGIAGDYLMKGLEKREARKTSIEDKLMEIQKARLTKRRGGGMQPKSLRDKTTGQSVIGSYDPYTDTMYVAGSPVNTSNYELAPGLSTQEFAKRQNITQANKIETADALGQGARISPDTGLLSVVRNGKVIPVQVSSSLLDPKQVKDLDSVVRPFISSDAYKKTASVLKFSKNVDSLLRDAMSGNPIASEMARSELAKLAEGGGKLTDQDIARLGGSQSYKNQVKRFVNLQKSGDPLLETDIDYMKRVAVILEKNAKQELMKSVTGLEQAASQKGVPAGATQTALMPYMPGLYESKAKAPVSLPPKKGMVVVEDMNGVKGYIPQQNLKKALESKKYKVVP